MTGLDFVNVFLTVLGVTIWSCAGYRWWKNKKAKKEPKESKGSQGVTLNLLKQAF